MTISPGVRSLGDGVGLALVVVLGLAYVTVGVSDGPAGVPVMAAAGCPACKQSAGQPTAPCTEHSGGQSTACTAAMSARTGRILSWEKSILEVAR